MCFMSHVYNLCVIHTHSSVQKYTSIACEYNNWVSVFDWLRVRVDSADTHIRWLKSSTACSIENRTKMGIRCIYMKYILPQNNLTNIVPICPTSLTSFALKGDQQRQWTNPRHFSLLWTHTRNIRNMIYSHGSSIGLPLRIYVRKTNSPDSKRSSIPVLYACEWVMVCKESLTLISNLPRNCVIFMLVFITITSHPIEFNCQENPDSALDSKQTFAFQ